MTLAVRDSATDPHAWRGAPVLRWSMYDLASSTYVALIPTFFGLYFVQVIGAGAANANALWGGIAAASLLLSALLAPVAGAWADRKRRWFTALAAATAVSVGATLLMGQASAGLVAASLFFIAGQVGYTLAMSQYDALLVRIGPNGQFNRASALGFSIGLAGGLIALALALWLLQGVPAESQVKALGTQFLLAGLLYGLIGLLALALLRRAAVAEPADAAASAASATTDGPLRTVWSTLRHWRQHRKAMVLLLGFFLINDVLVTLQFFSGILLRDRFTIGVEQLLWLSVLFHVVALPSTLVAGALADRLGAARVMFGMCGVLAAALLLLAFGTMDWTPTAAAVLLGLVFAALQAVFRAMYAQQVPPAQMAELFGFNAVAGRLSAAFGPLVFGTITALSGTVVALMALLVPLAAGALLLLRAQR